MSEQVAVARAIAHIAHLGQTDKAGAQYIGHPERVVARLSMDAEYDTRAAAAWLHDVLEDTPVSESDLLSAGIPNKTIEVVRKLTRREDTTPEDYYEQIRYSPNALAVKLADIADNTAPERLALLDDATIARLTRKYAKARLLLGATHA